MPIRITVLMKKLDSISTSEFHEYWRTTHAPLFLTNPTARQLLLKYSQYHISHTTTTTESEFDGAAEFVVAKIEDFDAILADPVYARDVVPDEEVFIKRSENVVLVGEEETMWIVVDEKQVEG